MRLSPRRNGSASSRPRFDLHYSARGDPDQARGPRRKLIDAMTFRRVSEELPAREARLPCPIAAPTASTSGSKSRATVRRWCWSTPTRSTTISGSIRRPFLDLVQGRRHRHPRLWPLREDDPAVLAQGHVRRRGRRDEGSRHRARDRHGAAASDRASRSAWAWTIPKNSTPSSWSAATAAPATAT